MCTEEEAVARVGVVGKTGFGKITLNMHRITNCVTICSFMTVQFSIGVYPIDGCLVAISILPFPLESFNLTFKYSHIHYIANTRILHTLKNTHTKVCLCVRGIETDTQRNTKSSYFSF